jgi:putative FmdB family regulatory protein
MPLFDFKCEECEHVQEHIVFKSSLKQLKCPSCSSSRYEKKLSKFRTNIEYRDNDEYMEKKIQPLIDETYEKIGKEATKEDTKTAENIFGKDKVETTYQ